MKNGDNLFGTRLREIIEDNSDSICGLQREIGIGTTTIHSWLHGHSIPHSDKLARVARFYGVSADWLLGLSNMRSVGKPIPRCGSCMMYAGGDTGVCTLNALHTTRIDFCSHHTACKYTEK